MSKILGMSLEGQKRFWEKVRVLGEDDCWLWQSGTNRKIRGYGHFKYKGKKILAHRISFAFAYGRELSGKEKPVLVSLG